MFPDSVLRGDCSLARRCAAATRALALLTFAITFLVGAVSVHAGNLPAAPSQQNARPLAAQDVEPWLDGYFSQALRSGDIAGGVVVVVSHGQIIAARGYGSADIAARRGVDPASTLFRIGSLTKLVTWTAVMQQVEAGRIDLDRDVNAYLDFTIPPYAGRPVTMRELMTHTAGFEEAGKGVIGFHAPVPLGTYLKRWVPTRVRPPGTTPAYSNWGAALAGYIVQRVSGVTFADYLDRRIFGPLGMSHSTIRQPLPPSLAPLMARGYPRASLPPQPFEMIGPAPAGGMSTTGLDMARFMIAHLEGGRGLMKSETAATMHSSPLDHVDGQSLIPPLDRAELGFLEHDINGRVVIGHRGATQNFHTLLALYVNDHVGLIASFNSAGRDGASEKALDMLSEAFADRYFPALPAVRPHVDQRVALSHAKMMAGEWQSSRGANDDFLALASLFGQTAIGVAPDGGLMIPSLRDPGGAPYQWDETQPFVWQSRTGHERLAAKVVGNRVVRWSTDTLAPTQVFDRVPLWHSAAWLVPALLVAVCAFLLTILCWPAAFLVRRHFGSPLALSTRGCQAFVAVRVAILAQVLIILGWLVFLARAVTDFDLLSSRSDAWLLTLEVGGDVAFSASVVTAVWNLGICWKDKRGWPAKAWSIVLVPATLATLYTAFEFGLMAVTVNY